MSSFLSSLNMLFMNFLCNDYEPYNRNSANINPILEKEEGRSKNLPSKQHSNKKRNAHSRSAKSITNSSSMFQSTKLQPRISSRTHWCEKKLCSSFRPIFICCSILLTIPLSQVDSKSVNRFKFSPRNVSEMADLGRNISKVIGKNEQRFYAMQSSSGEMAGLHKRGKADQSRTLSNVSSIPSYYHNNNKFAYSFSSIPSFYYHNNVSSIPYYYHNNVSSIPSHYHSNKIISNVSSIPSYYHNEKISRLKTSEPFYDYMEGIGNYSSDTKMKKIPRRYQDSYGRIIRTDTNNSSIENRQNRVENTQNLIGYDKRNPSVHNKTRFYSLYSGGLTGDPRHRMTNPNNMKIINHNNMRSGRKLLMDDSDYSHINSIDDMSDSDYPLINSIDDMSDGNQSDYWKGYIKHVLNNLSKDDLVFLAGILTSQLNYVKDLWRHKNSYIESIVNILNYKNDNSYYKDSFYNFDPFNEFDMVNEYSNYQSNYLGSENSVDRQDSNNNDESRQFFGLGLLNFNDFFLNAFSDPVIVGLIIGLNVSSS